MKTISARVHSFDKILYETKVIIQRFSETGFHLKGPKYLITCFHCGCSISDWFNVEKYVVPFEQHAILFSKCEFLMEIKEDYYISMMNKNYFTN